MEFIGTLLGFGIGIAMALITTGIVYYNARAELIAEGNWV